MLGIPHPANIGASHMSQRTVSFVIGCEKCDLGEAAVAYEYDSCADAFAEKQPDNVHSIFTYKSYKEIQEEEEAQKKEEKIEEEVVVEMEPQPLNIPAPNEIEEEVEEAIGSEDEESDDFSLMGGHLFEEPEDLSVDPLFIGDDDKSDTDLDVDLDGGFLFIDDEVCESADDEDLDVDLAGGFLFVDESGNSSDDEEPFEKAHVEEKLELVDLLVPRPMVKMAS